MDIKIVENGIENNSLIISNIVFGLEIHIVKMIIIKCYIKTVNMKKCCIKQDRYIV